VTERAKRDGDYTVTQVAELFGCGTQAIYNWITSGRLKAYRLGGSGPYRVPAVEVERARAEWIYKPEVGSAL